MERQVPVSFTYTLAKQEIDEAIARALPQLLQNSSICKDDIIELFGMGPLERDTQTSKRAHSKLCS
ncbi:MAG: hypothetical protein COB67_08520 [SAR324 cluster bacterium]|uniref:Uncharacterized protein n=1 Tax=SAR324 cluster bacterium TaxID=2024889 RepID=A0A2A4T2B2_9DELT|nr:MAG: hypothetical protein COB67_08520 [SAR324 cluster bacterium]